ncbi:MAG: sulfatase family protein [Promethearchaeota archaeon]
MTQKYPPNIIIFMLDSLRPDHLGCYGCDIAKTPNIDELEEQGIKFTNAYSEYPVTIPTRTALIAGIYTHTNRTWKPMTSYDLHITNLLKRKGYKTALFGDSPMTIDTFNCHIGFDVFKHSPYGKVQFATRGADQSLINVNDFIWGGEHLGIKSKIGEYGLIAEQLILKHTLANEKFLKDTKGLRRSELITNWVLDYLEKIEKEKAPFFLWIDHFEPHEPWFAPNKYLKPFEHLMDKSAGICPMPPSESYLLPEGVIKNLLAHVHATNYEVDKEVGRVIKKVDELGLTDDTVFIIISDHGEPYGEHGRIRKYGVIIYDELAKIPFIVKGPGFEKRQKIDSLLTTPDISRFILETAKTRIHKNMEALSLYPVINNKNSQIDSIHDMIFFGAFQIRAGCRTPKWKFIDNRGEKGGLDELYDMENDPEEKHNLIDECPEIGKALNRDVWEFGMQWARQLAFRDHPLHPFARIKIDKQAGKNFQKIKNKI